MTFTRADRARAGTAHSTGTPTLPQAFAAAELPDAPRQLSEAEARCTLNDLDGQIEAVVLRRQHPITGLLPASTAHTVHGNYGDAWVRDCVYSIQCVWGLALAHRRLGGPSTRVFELEQRVLQLMRGLLNAMLRQAPKVERFKHSLAPLDAIHAKFDTATGNPVVPDDGWGHLQLDATGLFLLQIAQLTRAGLVVVQTSHERDFLQNLVYYVARAYRVADYGIWERGDKGNHGLPERNASSIGLVKAALEALDGLDLYGPHGDGRSRLHIPHDAIVRLRRALQGLLPRESASKEVDSACLSVIGYPAWAVEDPRLIQRTRAKIREVLGGAYGYKRFPRDGHQTVVEDHNRLHYEREELAAFTAIECEWPLFFAYELVTACCEERWQEAWLWRSRLDAVSVMVDGVPLLPELYLVPGTALEAERAGPGSQPRVANPNVPLLWTQSLTWLGDLMLQGLLLPSDLDPCGRRQGRSLGAEKVLVGLVPATEAIADVLSAAGLPVTAPKGGAVKLRVASSKELSERMARVGRNPRLGLGGHPPVRMEAMATARLYTHGEDTLAFLPAVLEEGTFYLADDPEQLVETVGSELRHLQRHWRGSGVPLLLIPVAEGPFQRDPEAFLRLGESLRSGLLESVPVELASLEAVVDQLTSVALPPEAGVEISPKENVGPLLRASTSRQQLTARQELELGLEAVAVADLAQRLWQSTSLPEQAELLEQLVRRLGLNAILQGPSSRGPVKLLALVEAIYHRALAEADWSVVRRCAGVIGLIHPQLEDALTDLLVRQKQVVVGRNYTHESLISQPQGSLAIAAMIERYSGEDGRERMLQQELLLALDGLARLEPGLLSGSLTLQLGQLLLLLTGELASERDLAPDEAFEALCGLPPHAIHRRLRAVLADSDHARAALQRKEQLHVSGRVRWDVPDPLEELPRGGDWLQQRQRQGALQRVPREFYAGIWDLLHHCKGLVIGDKLERRNRLECALLAEMTSGERNFATLVEHLLSKIEAAEYRQLCTETLISLITFVEANPQVQFDDYLALDVVIGHAVRVGWQQNHADKNAASYALHKAEAWEQFYGASPANCRRWQILALKELTQLG
ncbi:glycoside hydrolase family 15 protein [Cyanobium sp. Morenito 9A2]|uniref:glycoside hydrolase family 15 protein n=1 Tax=Cyanobium sp. Morenito 9A2 TaxID=2823718 RepID=UPI0020CE466F|nr:glycoside hydrolase family 15 protein [Cyanobium sp. Morenito 9A2]MCP9849616.1 phosphorylase kinase [Cyanobium sp. Morenito 9A2]